MFCHCETSQGKQNYLSVKQCIERLKTKHPEAIKIKIEKFKKGLY